MKAEGPRDGQRLIGAGGVQWTIFAPAAWRLDRWLWWFAARHLPRAWWPMRPMTGRVSATFDDRVVWVRVVSMRSGLWR